MKTYIALLRGINVSGHKIIRMEILRKVLEELKFKNISTYIQSGNILFESDNNAVSILEKQIADKIEEHFGFVVPVTIVTLEELKTIVEKNPFGNQKIEEFAQSYVAFLSTTPTPAAIEFLRAIDFGNERFVNVGKTLYLFYANSAANTKLSNVLIENKLRLKATSRNWKTINKLLELATAMAGK